MMEGYFTVRPSMRNMLKISTEWQQWLLYLPEKTKTVFMLLTVAKTLKRCQRYCHIANADLGHLLAQTFSLFKMQPITGN